MLHNFATQLFLVIYAIHPWTFSIIICHMSDYVCYQQDQTDYNYVQLSQKCMRCRGYLRGDQETVSDPRYRNCESHAECVRWEYSVASSPTELQSIDTQHSPPQPTQSIDTQHSPPQSELDGGFVTPKP